MTQQFKFGDRVYFPSNVEEIGIVIQVLNSENKIVVAWNDGEQTTEAIDDVQLTIIPHPDTARLDWLESQDNLRVTTLHSHSGVRGSPVEISYRIEKTDCVLMKNIIFKNFNTLRQSIDHAMQQEQTK